MYLQCTAATINNTAGATAIVVNTTDATCGQSNGSITLGGVTGGLLHILILSTVVRLPEQQFIVISLPVHTQ